jgi:hypothetical protein
MAVTVLSDSDEPRLMRPARKIKPSAALLEHSEKAALPSQIKAINTFQAAEAAKHASNNTQLPSSPPTPEATVSAPILANKRARTEDIEEGYEPSDEECENNEDDEECENAWTNPCKSISIHVGECTWLTQYHQPNEHAISKILLKTMKMLMKMGFSWILMSSLSLTSLVPHMRIGLMILMNSSANLSSARTPIRHWHGYG